MSLELAPTVGALEWVVTPVGIDRIIESYGSLAQLPAVGRRTEY
jgi:hypothetical protein